MTNDNCYDWKQFQGLKTYDYQNKSTINLIGWQVYDMASYIETLMTVIRKALKRSRVKTNHISDLSANSIGGIP